MGEFHDHGAEELVDELQAENESLSTKVRFLEAACTGMREEYDALAARLAEAERDAARYRWLCEFKAWPEDVEAAFDCGPKVLIDEAIDAAMASETVSEVQK